MKVHGNIKVLTWFNFFTDFKLYAPIAIIYFAKISGSYALGMAVFSITMVASALFELPTGVFSDMIGRRKTVIWGAAAAVIYSIFYAAGISFWVLALGAVFEGLSRAFYSGNDDALLHDSLAENHNEKEYSKFLGQVSSMFQLALAVAGILGSVMASWSFPLIMWLSVIPQGICLWLATKLVEPKVNTDGETNIYAHLKEAVKQFVGNKKLRYLGLVSTISYATGESSYLFMAAFYQSLWPLWAIGFGKTLSNVGAFLSFKVSGKIVKKHGEAKVLMVAKIYNRVVNMIATAIPTVLSPLLMASSSLWFGLTEVAQNSLMQKEFTQKQRATMGSLNSFFGSLLFGVVSVSMGAVADKLSPGRAILLFQIVTMPLLLVYWLLFKDEKQAEVKS